MKVILILADGTKKNYSPDLLGRRVKIRNIIEGILATNIFKPEDGSKGYWAEVPISTKKESKEMIRIFCDLRGAELRMGEFNWKELDCKKDLIIRKVKDSAKKNWQGICAVSSAGVNNH